MLVVSFYWINKILSYVINQVTLLPVLVEIIKKCKLCTKSGQKFRENGWRWELVFSTLLILGMKNIKRPCTTHALQAFNESHY